MPLQDYKETGGEPCDYEDTPRYWAQHDMEISLIKNEREERIRNGD